MQEVAEHVDISIHALRKESDAQFPIDRWLLVISIHALRKESDMAIWNGSLVFVISIHALRKESDIRKKRCHIREGLFQSTLSVRRATKRQGRTVVDCHISIHALRKESDMSVGLSSLCCQYFNPRSP